MLHCLWSGWTASCAAPVTGQLVMLLPFVMLRWSLDTLCRRRLFFHASTMAHLESPGDTPRLFPTARSTLTPHGSSCDAPSHSRPSLPSPSLHSFHDPTAASPPPPASSALETSLLRRPAAVLRDLDRALPRYLGRPRPLPRPYALHERLPRIPEFWPKPPPRP